MKKIVLFLLVIIVSFSLAYLFFNITSVDFIDLSPEQMHQKIIAQREIAIAKAEELGDYKCCIQPACTMCYDSANKWNYDQAGKCFCDEFIARGEEPCPQCEKGLACNSSSQHGLVSDVFCEINLNNF